MANGEASRMRIERLRDWMRGESLDAFLIRNTSDIVWASAFEGVFDDEQAHMLLVTPHNALLHTDSRYIEACGSEAEGGIIAVDATRETHAKWCAKRLRGCARVGFDDEISLFEYRALLDAFSQGGSEAELVSSAQVVLNLRAVKDSFELERLRAAQAITDAGFAHIVDFIRAGMTEREVQLELDRFMYEAGADGLSFPTIVATGAHGSSPHAQPGDTVIRRGDAIVMDFGARRASYCSDMTRTVFVTDMSTELCRAYETLRRANEECEAMLCAGVAGSAVHAHAENVLAEGGYAGKMGHSLGHGVGIDIHEKPLLSPANHMPLAEGSVVTVEPGIYIPGSFGMRLEDCGLVTEGGYRPFAASTHEPVIVA